MASQIKLLADEWPDLAESAAAPRTKSKPEDLFAAQLEQFKTLVFERQLMFAKAAMGRRWQFDFSVREYMVAVEIEGIVPRRVGNEFVAGGRHGSVAGIIEDMEKYNSAALLGWTVLRFPAKYVKPRHAIDMTLRVLAARGWRYAETAGNGAPQPNGR